MFKYLIFSVLLMAGSQVYALEAERKAITDAAQTFFVKQELPLKDAVTTFYSLQRVFSNIAIISNWSFFSNKEVDAIKARLRTAASEAEAQEKIWAVKQGFPWSIDLNNKRNWYLAMTGFVVTGYTLCRIGETYIIKPLYNRMSKLTSDLYNKIRSKNSHLGAIEGNGTQSKNSNASGASGGVPLQRSQ